MKLALAILCLAACTVCALDGTNVDGKDSPTTQHRVGIEGGKLINIEKRPYTVALQGKGLLQGTGVLIEKDWVITTAFNMFYFSANSSIRVASNNALEGGESVKVAKIVTHPNYNLSWAYDLTLIKLSKPIKTSNKVKPISLATTLPKSGANTVISGYGTTKISWTSDGRLREAVIPLIPVETCKSLYKGQEKLFQNICASKQHVGGCVFDWGAPLVYKNKLIGIFAGSEGDCDSNQYPGVFTDITKYRDWIKTTIRT